MSLVSKRVVARTATAFAVVVVTSFPALSAVAATSPLGDVAGAWPSAWTTYLTTGGAAVVDPTGDVHPGTVDLASGTGTSPTVYYAADAANLFVRLRIAANPASDSKGGLDSEAYVVRLLSGGIPVAVAGVNGKSPSTDYVFVAAGDGSGVIPVYEYPFTATSAGMRVVADGAGQFFLDFQVPLARLGVTTVQLVAGTTSSANLTNLNKDVTAAGASVTLVEPPVVPEPTVLPVEPTPPVEEPTPPVVEPSPPVEEPTPPVEEPTPPVVEPTPPVDEPSPSVEDTVEPPVEEPVAPEPPADPVVPEPPADPVVPEPPADPVVPEPPVLPGPVLPPVASPAALPGPVLPDAPSAEPAARAEVRERHVTRELARTGVPTDVAVATGAVLIAVGTALSAATSRYAR